MGYSLNEEGLLPYQFDVVDYNTIDNDALREHIDRVVGRYSGERDEAHIDMTRSDNGGAYVLAAYGGESIRRVP